MARNKPKKERHLLCGPNSKEAEELVRDGWNPDKFLESHDEIFQSELRLSERMDDPVISEGKNWRKGRLRDLLLVREVCSSYLDRMNALQKYQFIRDKDTMRTILESEPLGNSVAITKFARSMPSLEVFMEMKVSAHRNTQTNWNPNDIFDMEAMSIAVPYCDIVVTENHAAHQLVSSKIDQRMNTAIISKLNQLPELLPL